MGSLIITNYLPLVIPPEWVGLLSVEKAFILSGLTELMTLNKYKNLLKEVLKNTRLGVLTKVFFNATMLTKVLFCITNVLTEVLFSTLKVANKHILPWVIPLEF